MDSIPEEGLPKNMSRSGIKMGYFRPLDPALVLGMNKVHLEEAFSSSEEESEWEKEINSDGSVAFVLPMMESNPNGNMQELTANADSKPTDNKKLSRQVRRRESKRDRSMLKTRPLMANDQQQSSDNDSSTYGQIKTFEAFFEASNLDQSVGSGAPNNDHPPTDDVTEIHEVTLKFSAKQIKAQIPHFQMLLHGDNPANSGLLLEALLGIIPNGEDANVVVADLVPHGPAVKSVKKGDIIRSLDGHHITLESANTYLLHKLSKTSGSSSTMKVKLIIQRPLTALKMEKKVSTPQHWKSLAESGAVCLIVSLNNLSEASPDLADVLYQFPKEDSELKPLVRIRGIFTTLVHLLPDLLLAKPQSSTILLARPYSYYHVAYDTDGDELFLVGLPAAFVTDSVTNEVMRDLKRLILLKYGSFMRAALAPSEEMDIIVGKRFHDVIQSKKPLSHADLLSRLESLFDSSTSLKLPDDIQFQVEDAMNQFESSDFQDFSEDFYDPPREFMIVGSCLFHRGLLVASHLSKCDLSNLKQILISNNLTKWTEPLSKAVLWQELNLPNSRGSSRQFLLVTGLGYQLLGVLLENGDCTSLNDGTVRPDPFYVDQAFNTLEHLAEMGIPLVCEKWLTLPHNPALLDIDNLFTAAAKEKKMDLKLAVHQQQPQAVAGAVLKRTKSVDLSSTSSIGSASPKPPQTANIYDNYEMSTAFRGDEDEDTSSNWEIPKGSRKSFSSYYNPDEERTKGSDALSELSYGDKSETDGSSSDVVTYQISKLTVTLDNTLLHYVQMDVGEGVMLSPYKKSTTGQLEGLLLENFANAARLMHANFEKSSHELNNAFTSKSPLVAVKEQGMLFRWSPIETLPTLSYWVCGRLFLTPDPKEFYVAYHESAPQQIVELAFRLAHGTPF